MVEPLITPNCKTATQLFMKISVEENLMFVMKKIKHIIFTCLADSAAKCSMFEHRELQ